MSDLALGLLLNYVDDSRQLWIVDEQGVNDVLPLLSKSQISAIVFVTNRYDQYLLIKKHTEYVFLSDFDFSLFDENSFEKIFFRVSKEKAVVHHCINAAKDLLSDNGCLVLSGFKHDGVQTYIKKATQYLGCLEEKKFGGKTSAVALIACQKNAAKKLDDNNYKDLSLIEIGDVNFYSKPGVFGWQKLDKGSELLISSLREYLEDNPRVFGRVLDLGCGYGFLSMAIAPLLEGTQFFATDNNMAALRCCEENFRYMQIDGIVFASDAGDVAQELNGALQSLPKMDLVICNPPFHQGFQHQGLLTEKFIRNTQRSLVKGGLAVWVVNAFIPVERLAQPLFSKVDVLANNKQFKVYLLTV